MPVYNSLIFFLSKFTATRYHRFDAEEIRADWGRGRFPGKLPPSISPPIAFRSLYKQTIQGPSREIWGEKDRRLLACDAQCRGSRVRRRETRRLGQYLPYPLRILTLTLPAKWFHNRQPNSFSMSRKKEGSNPGQFSHFCVYWSSASWCFTGYALTWL